MACLNKLTVRALDGTQQDYEIRDGALVVGRDPGCGVSLKDSQVSWRHATLVCRDGECTLEDLNSTNGTFVGGQRVQKRLIQTGEQISIGPFQLRLQLRDAPSPTSASEKTLFAASREQLARGARSLSKGAAEQEPKTRWRTGPRMRAIVPDAQRLRAVVSDILPAVTWPARYERSNLRADLLAGVTVAATMVPQGMAYALLAGLPPAMGLYASIIPMIIYALIGSGRHTSVAPVTVDSLIVVLGLSAFATAMSPSYITLTIMLTAIVGGVQLAMGVLRLGFIVNFLSYPVLAGFTSAVAIITALAQLTHLLGISQPEHATVHDVALHVLAHATQANGATLAVGVGCILILWAMLRWAPKMPAALGLVVICTALAYGFGLDSHGVPVLGEVPSGLPVLSVPSLRWAEAEQLLPLALTLALVGFAQTISVGKSLGNKYGYDVDANRELTALGLANMSSSVSQGYVVSGSLARSALNASSGAKTPLASIVTAVCVLATTLWFTPLFRHLPNATLAAILVVSAIRLIDLTEIRYLFKVKITEGILLVFTFAATLALGIMTGLVLGIVASILLFITLNTRPHTAILGRLPNTNIFRNVQHFPEAQTFPGLVILRIDASLYFANVVFLKATIHDICKQHQGDLKALILDASAVNDLDSSADTALHQLSDEFKQKGIAFYIAGIKAPVREVMRRSGLYGTLGGDHFFFTIDAAVKRYQEKAAYDARAAGRAPPRF
jgi:SulP family sulfate permease